MRDFTSSRVLHQALFVTFATVCSVAVGAADKLSRAAGAEPLNSLNQTGAPVPSTAVEVVGTNTLADAARINTAIANSPRGAEIVIRGQCLINETIRLLGNRSYRGESRTGTVLKQADGANLVAVVASSTFLDNKPWTDGPVSVRHLRLDGNREHNSRSATAGLILRSWLSVVEDVHIKDAAGDGLRVTSRSADGTGLRTTQVNGRIANCFVERSGRHGIFVEDTQNAVTDWILCDSWIASSGVDGIHLDNAAGWYIERNHIYGVPENAIHAHRLFATSISNNYIEGFGEGDRPGTWHGIYATLQGGAGSTIANNRIMNRRSEERADCSYRYIALNVNYGTGVAVVTGNVIRGKRTAEATGLHYQAPGDRKLVVTSALNLVHDVQRERHVGPHVTLTAGQ